MIGDRRPPRDIVNINSVPSERELGQNCNCGSGYCEVHGTYDLSSDGIEDIHPQKVHGTRGGQRVVKKKLGGDNY